MTNPVTTPGLVPYFVPVDVEDQEQHALFYAQRVVCGWKYDRVDSMFEQMRQGERTLYWICTPSRSALYVSRSGTEVVDEADLKGKDTKDWVKMPLLYVKATENNGGGGGTSSSSRQGLLPVGHISIDFRDFEIISTPLLGSPDCSGAVVSITTLFVLPSYRKHGLARWAMFEAERLIRLGLPGKVKCEQIGLSTLSERHWTMPGPDGTGLWARTGLKGVGWMAEGIESKYLGGWYTSLGYQKVDDTEKFRAKTVTGEQAWWWGEIWSKKLQ